MKIIDLGILVEETWARVDSLLIDETILPSDLQDELRRVLDSLTRIYGVLPLSMDGYFQGNISPWLIKLKQVSYEAEDVVDDYEILRPKVTLFNFHQKLVFNHKFARKIKILNQSLDKINLDAIKYEARYDDRIIPPTRIQVDRLIDNPIIGREADASKIVSLMLTRSSDQQVVIVVPIVGMRGLGKTALAKLVCRQAMAFDLFDVKMWVCVSDKCDEVNILGQMLTSLNATARGLTGKNAILEQLEKELRGKRFLLVLDDVWGDVSSWWDNLRTQLLKICKHNEIVVLVTTRCEEIASIVQTSSQHRHTLDFLSDDDCWFILKERALGYFAAYPILVQSNLEAIGKGIAKKCRGVPLAAEVLGGTLRLNMDEGEWLEIIDSLVSEAGNNEENVERILQLCFSYLPSSLKQCFAICSVFPKGFLMIKEDLIQMWMAERLVDSCDMANEYFHVLLVNSFFQDAESDADGNVIKCKMLNIVLDFALDQFEICHPDSYLYVDYQSIRTSKALPKNKVKCLTTIILNGAPFRWYWDPSASSLRMLYLNDVDIEKVPLSVSKLKHFRYLHISNTEVRPLPECITKINRLHMLTLSNCSCEHLPLLGHLPFLKFLKISHMKRVKCIGNESYGGSSSRHELRLFPALKSLSLSWMENLTEWSLSSHGNLVVMFPRLQNLSIQCCPKLKRFPIRDILTLVKIEIKDCEELRFIFDEHKSFPSITSLSIVGCTKLFYLRNWLLLNESYEEFKVRKCAWLKFIPDDLGMQSSLTSLEIYCCKGLRVFSEEILGKLTRLRKLSIGAFSEKLDDFRYLNRIKDLRRLEELEIWGSDVFGRNMSALPNQLQHLDGLRSLKIKGFTTMEALPDWLSNLRYLETICLNYCWHLEYESTAATIQRLPNLSHVYIYGCRALEEHKSQWIEFSDLTKIRIFFQ